MKPETEISWYLVLHVEENGKIQRCSRNLDYWDALPDFEVKGIHEVWLCHDTNFLVCDDRVQVWKR